MKKIAVAVCMAVFLGSTLAVAAPGFAGKKIRNSKLVQATKDTTVDFVGVKVFVPQGQTVILGQRENGSIVVRGLNLKGIKFNDATVSTNGYTVMSYYPSSNIAFLNRGNTMTITDPSGNTATVANEGAIATNNANINSNTIKELKEQAKAETAQVEAELGEDVALPAFVAQTATSEAAAEQATQNVEETESTLSPSTPR